MRFIQELLGLLLVLELAFAIHEYGHFQEMRKRNVGIKEFSLGVGPVLYERPLNNFTFSVRVFPIMAYVEPTKDGHEKMARMPILKKLFIDLAGVRNNFLAVVLSILLLQWKNRQSVHQLLISALLQPFKLLFLFIQFAVDLLTFGRIKIFGEPTLSIDYLPVSMYFKNFIIFNLYLGLFNFMPIYPLDGGRIFISVLSLWISDGRAMAAAQMISILLVFIYAFFGESKLKLVK